MFVSENEKKKNPGYKTMRIQEKKLPLLTDDVIIHAKISKNL